jgi:hypothetical protein
MYVFLGTWRTSRGGLGAGIEVYDKETIIKKLKGDTKKHWINSFRYAKVNEGCSSLIKEMRLEEFEEIFELDLFTPDEITKFFRKEISDKYGEHSIRKEMKRISKKDLEVGRVYLADNGDEVYYFGNIKGSLYTPEKEYSYWSSRIEPAKTEEFEGYCFVDCYNKNRKFDELFRAYHTPHVVKSVRKLIEVKEYKIEVPRIHEEEKDGYKLRIEFLDVK